MSPSSCAMPSLSRNASSIGRREIRWYTTSARLASDSGTVRSAGEVARPLLGGQLQHALRPETQLPGDGLHRLDLLGHRVRV